MQQQVFPEVPETLKYLIILLPGNCEGGKIYLTGFYNAFSSRGFVIHGFQSTNFFYRNAGFFNRLITPRHER
jgi:hypothetical protein